MSNLDKLQSIIPTLTEGEKAFAFQMLAMDLWASFPGIDKQPDVLGGSAHISRTRIPVWLLVQARSQGVSESELLQAYPTLTAQDLVNAWRYTERYPEEIQKDIKGQEV